MSEEAGDNKPPSGMEEILAELEKQKAADIFTLYSGLSALSRPRRSVSI